jgi:hypothetical protein
MATLPVETPKKCRDLFAELYVAGALADGKRLAALVVWH